MHAIVWEAVAAPTVALVAAAAAAAVAVAAAQAAFEHQGTDEQERECTASLMPLGNHQRILHAMSKVITARKGTSARSDGRSTAEGKPLRGPAARSDSRSTAQAEPWLSIICC